MKTVYLLFFLINFIYSKSFAQDSILPVYEIKSDTAVWTVIPHTCWQILEDKQGTLSFEEVSNGTAKNRFHDSLPRIDQNVKVYWIHYTLRNSMNRPAYISIDGRWDFTDTYIHKENKGWLVYKSGTHRNWDERDGLKYSNALPDTLKPMEEVTIYQRLESNTSGILTNFGIGYLGTQSVIQSDYIEALDKKRTNHYDFVFIQESFIVGLLFLAMMLNLFFFTIVKEKEYLYFSLFALFLSLNRTYNILGTYFYWNKPELIGSEKWLTYSWAFIPLFLLLFFIHFLKINKYYPIWCKILISLGILNFFMTTARFIILYIIYDNQISNIINKFNFKLLPFFIIPLSIFITLFLFIKQKNTSIRLIIIGAFPLPMLYFVNHIYAYFLHYDFVENFRFIELISLVWLVIFLTLTLLLRYDQLRKQNADKQLENERLAKEKEIERNELIATQKLHLENKVKERTAELKQSLDDLKATQAQLIQKEKLASLGELTAGIAHEIQNPLNFVNNFSEVSTELLEELSEELPDELKTPPSGVGGLLADIIQNQEKINHHGKRAASIVRGMLEHSKASTGKKELTDINALVNEYARLAYSNLRSKNEDVTVAIETHLEDSLPDINIIPQDIGRVLLNLINNAFWAVQEQGKRRTEQGISDYKPTVMLTTKAEKGQISIKVSDNGIGMSEATKSKIFQPFFTTKPTGEGTGLGLSLAYDIVTKGHGGTLEVESVEGFGTTFRIKLPII